MVPAKLNVVTLGVRDLRRLRDFYTALGWEVAIEADDFVPSGSVVSSWGCSRGTSLPRTARPGPRRGSTGCGAFSLGINVERPEQVDEIIAAVERAGAVVTKPPGDPIEFEGRNAYFADPEENYWEVVYLKSGAAGQGIIGQGEQ